MPQPEALTLPLSSPLPLPRRQSLERWAAEKPDAIAVRDGDRHLSWAELNGQADSFARALAARGLRPGNILAVRTIVRHEWCVIVAAAAKLGCPLLCLNWRMTPAEISYMLTNSRAQAIVCDDENPTALSAAWSDQPDMIAVSIDRSAGGFLTFSELLEEAGPPLVSAKGPAFIIYTSGTTGRPKGVFNEQPTPGREHQVAEYLDDVTARGNQRPGDVVLVCLPVHHGAGANTVHKAIEFGNELVLMRRYDPEDALRLISAYRISFWFAVPTIFQRLAALPAHVLTSSDVSSMRAVLVGGAPVPPTLKIWMTGFFGDRVTEAYGSTESSLISAATPETRRLKPESSGPPYRHVDVSIRDDQGLPLPAGTVGELWVKTPFCFTGYLGAPPLGTDVMDADGYFRMGDAGYLDEDGCLFITDRIKDMIISGGVNIYPAEIEAALLGHPAVQDVAIIGIPNDEFGEEVRGYVELKPAMHASEAELLAFAAQQLASYKRPRSLSLIDTLPRNTMGKVLKAELRAPFWRDRARRV